MPIGKFTSSFCISLFQLNFGNLGKFRPSASLAKSDGDVSIAFLESQMKSGCGAVQNVSARRVPDRIHVRAAFDKRKRRSQTVVERSLH